MRPDLRRRRPDLLRRRAGRVSSRAAIIATLAVLAGGLLVAVVAGTPWRPLPSDAPTVAVDATRDFTAAQIAREDAFHAASRPPAYLSLALGLVIALVLGLSPLGARLVSAVASPFGGGWWWRVVLGTVAITLLSRLLVLPLDGWREAVLRRYGLSTRGWGGWLADVGKSYGVGLVLTLVVVVGVLGLARRSPDWWWAWAAALGAVLVIVISFAYPIVVEPVFNRFTPMAAGPLRTSLLDLAARDGVPAKDVLVADASRRTSTVNAYVSGFGATRRIVVYDNLVDQASPEEVRLVVAHELGHAKNKDVLWGTLAGALGIAALVCVLGLLLRSEWLLGRAGVSSAGDARAVALLLALVAVLGSGDRPRAAAGQSTHRSTCRRARFGSHSRPGTVRDDAAAAVGDELVRPRPVTSRVRPLRVPPHRPATHCPCSFVGASAGLAGAAVARALTVAASQAVRPWKVPRGPRHACPAAVLAPLTLLGPRSQSAPTKASWLKGRPVGKRCAAAGRRGLCGAWLRSLGVTAITPCNRLGFRPWESCG